MTPLRREREGSRSVASRVIEDDADLLARVRDQNYCHIPATTCIKPKPWIREAAVISRILTAVAIVGLALTTVAPLAKAASPPEIWFAPMEAERNPNGHGIVFNKHDFPAMVASDEAWKQAASQISVLQINAIGIMEAYQDVPSVIAMINRNHFKIAASGNLVYTDHLCEVNSEGMSNDVGYERELVGNLHRWKLAGGRLDYLVMDSPLVFGYYVTQKQCHFSIEEVARRTAVTFKRVQQDFPDVKIVDAEGPAWLLPAAWLPDYARFFQAFQMAAGKPIDDGGLWKMVWYVPGVIAQK